MPYIVRNPDNREINLTALTQRDYNYKYPEGLDLRPSSNMHQFLVARLLHYGFESSRIYNERHTALESIDDTLTGYIALSEEERRIKNEDPRKPVSIVFPYSYAILETLVSYLVAAFLPDPIFRYEGNGPEDVAGATLMQHVIALHAARNKIALNLHTFFRDACAYGFGAVAPQWTVKLGKRVSFDEFGGRSAEDTVLFEGNSLLNVDPYCYLPDPSVPIHDVQRGEYVGWTDRTNMMDLLTEEENDEDMFNVKYLQHLNGKASSILGTLKHQRTSRRGTNYDVRLDRLVSDPVDLFHVYAKIIPRQWRLGSSDRPEKWLFTVAADSVVIRAKPLGLYHNMFPVCVCAPDFDGYSPIAYSKLEILGGMQTTIDWLFNSHIANVRKSLNDMLVVDPYLININDLKSPEPGKLIRLRRPGWGKNMLDNAVKQLSIVDITANNIAEVAAVIQYMQSIASTDNPVMGNLRRGGPERLTSSEFQATTRGAVNRLERVARVVGLQGLQDMGYMFAYHTQQLMEEDVWIRTVGEWPQQIAEQFQIDQGRVKVRPRDIAIDYDLLVRDGSVPGGNFSDVWVQLFQTIGNSELLLQRFDIVRIFEYIATNLGAKNVADFRIKQAPAPVSVTTAPDEVVAQQAQAGNLIPIFNGAA